MTKIQIIPKWSDVKPAGDYVYTHKRLSDGAIFYVGKGTNNRGWHVSKWSGRSKWWRNVAEKHGVLVEIVQDNMSEEDAFLLEMWLIAKFRNEGVELCNVTDGGEGSKGVPSQNSIQIDCSNGLTFDNSYEAAEWLRRNGLDSASHSYISSAVRGDVNSAYGLSWWATGSNPVEYKCNKHFSIIAKRKPVMCSNGMSFPSLKAASEWVSSWRGSSSSGPIADCCHRRTLSAYGLSWWFEGHEKIGFIPRYERASVSRGKPLVRGDGVRFHSAGEAARFMTKERGIRSSGSYISKAANNGSLAYGYRWSR